MIIDMGTHMLTGQVGSQNLLQVAVPGLEDRARTFPPLLGVLLMPGKHTADVVHSVFACVSICIYTCLEGKDNSFLFLFM